MNWNMDASSKTTPLSICDLMALLVDTIKSKLIVMFLMKTLANVVSRNWSYGVTPSGSDLKGMLTLELKFCHKGA